MTGVILAGNGITAEILHSHLEEDPRFHIVCLTADEEYITETRHATDLETIPLGSLTAAYPPESHQVIMAMGYRAINSHRKSMFERLRSLGYRAITYVHPLASVSTRATLAEGSVVLPCAVVEPHAYVGENSVLWAGSVVAHHSRIGSHCWVASGAVIAGQARVGDSCFVGVNATIVDGVTVGDDCFIGANALISRDTAVGTVQLARSAEQVRFSSQQYSQYFGV